MLLVNELLEDLDKTLWYCSLDMASGFWVVSMTERARLISAFVTHQGIGRTYQRIRKHFHWRGLFRSVQRYVVTVKPAREVQHYEEGPQEISKLPTRSKLLRWITSHPCPSHLRAIRSC